MSEFIVEATTPKGYKLKRKKIRDQALRYIMITDFLFVISSNWSFYQQRICKRF